MLLPGRQRYVFDLFVKRETLFRLMLFKQHYLFEAVPARLFLRIWISVYRQISMSLRYFSITSAQTNVN
jgi:hypothetical protein